MAGSEAQGESTVDDANTSQVLYLFRDAAAGSPAAMQELALDLKERGTEAEASENTHVQEVIALLRDYEIPDHELKKLGSTLSQTDALKIVSSMNVDVCMKSVPSGADPVRVLMAYVDTAVETAKTTARALKMARPDAYNDSQEAGMRAPIRDRTSVKLVALVSGVFCFAYLTARIVDIVLLQQQEHIGKHTFYRICIMFVEMAFGMSAALSLVVRSRKQTPLADVSEDDQRVFQPAEILTLLMVTDEDAKAISTSVTSHYGATRSLNLPYKVILIAETQTKAIDDAMATLSTQFPNLMMYTYEALAAQDYKRGTGANSYTAQNIVMASNMSMGTAIYYALDRLHYAEQHFVGLSCVCVMDASSVVDAEKYYDFATNNVCRFGVSLVNTPTQVRNHNRTGDFMDMNGLLQENVIMPGALADNKCAIYNKAFMARGYSLYRMLRRMELENVGTRTLDWMMYYMNVEATQACLALHDASAPTTSRLCQTDIRTALQQQVTSMVESFDVFCIFFREHSFTSWDLFSPLGAPHYAARAASLMEFTIVLVILLTVLAGILPWSTSNLYVAGGFLLHYGWMMFAQIFTAFGAKVTMAASSFRNRVLACVSILVYFFDLSRFTVDRRGHFRTAGETTTANLVHLRQERGETRGPNAKKFAADKAAAEKATAAAAAASIPASQEPPAVVSGEVSEDETANADSQYQAAPVAEGVQYDKNFASAPSMFFDTDSDRLQSVVLTRPSSEPVAEGLFSKKKAAPPPAAEAEPVSAEEADDFEAVPTAEPVSNMEDVDVTVEVPPVPDKKKKKGAKAGKASTNGIVYRAKPKVPKAKRVKVKKTNFAPKVTDGGGRTGKGSVMNPYLRLVRSGSVFAFLLVLAALATVYFAYDKLIGSNRPINYTVTEILAARSWLLCCMLLSLFIAIPAFILMAMASGCAGIVTNRISGVVIIVLTIICVLGTGALPFLAHQTLKSRDAMLSFPEVMKSNSQFFAAMQAGPAPDAAATNAYPSWRGATPEVTNTNGASLAGGWYTGPGNSKFTYPQAMAVVDMSMSIIANYAELEDLGALDQMQDMVAHGASYLLNTYDTASGSLVAYVAPSPLPGLGGDWTRPELSGGAQVFTLTGAPGGAGVETYCAVAAALAAASRALAYTVRDEIKDIGTLARQVAPLVYNTSRLVTASYETAFPGIGEVWPSNGNLLNDDHLLAASVMLLAFSEDTYKNHVEGYYTIAQRDRGQAGIHLTYNMDVDDHWWTANLLLSLADPLNTRYSGAMETFADAWTDSGDLLDPTGITVTDGLSYARSEFWEAASQAGNGNYVTNGPLGQNMRAMAYIALYTSSRVKESSSDRKHSCYAQGQLRHVLGANTNSQSYMVGNAIGGASFPKRVHERASSCPPDPGSACGSGALSSGAANPSVLKGAIVHGPTITGAFTDTRTEAKNTGVSILNNSPLPMLLASLKGRDLDISDCIGLNPKASLGKTASVAVEAPALLEV